jgi:hypothetical protein
MKFIELKDASFWSNKNKIMKDIGELILAASEIAFVSRHENNTDYTMVVLRGGELMVITATPYEEIKSKLIEEGK